MKLVGFWLLVLFAVLVPATASIATSMICPTASEARLQERGQAAPSTTRARHAPTSGAHAVVKVKDAGKAVPVEQQAEPCCDGAPCGQCASCGSCASMAAAPVRGTPVRPVAVATLGERDGPRTEFLLAGQERPPRTC